MRLLVLAVNGAHANFESRRRHLQALPHAHRAGIHRAGDHAARAFQHKAAVNREPKAAVVYARGALGLRRQQQGAQLGDAKPRRRRAGHDRAARQRGVGEQGQNLLLDFHRPRRLYAINLAQRHRAALDAKQTQNRQMLARLRHRAVVCRHHQQREIDAGDARQHVSHKALVTRHIHKANDPRRIARARQRQIREAQINRHATCALFRQAVGVDAGQRANERGFAMIDMAGGSDDHAPAASLCSWLIKPASSSRQRKSSHSAP